MKELNSCGEEYITLQAYIKSLMDNLISDWQRILPNAKQNDSNRDKESIEIFAGVHTSLVDFDGNLWEF